MTKQLIPAALGATLIFVNVGGVGCAQRLQPAPVPQIRAAFTQTTPLLHPLFSDNAVLQRDRPLPVWGWAMPGARVEVQLDDTKQAATAGVDGRWTTTFAPHATGGTHTMTVTAGGSGVTRKNLLFGDVWLCSGQSNMAYDLHGVQNPDAEIAAANYPEIRLLQVPSAVKNTPQDTFKGVGWQVCSPQTVATFSGVGYFFGRDLYKKLKVPIGLIDSSVSGTPGEAWVSAPALATLPDWKPAVDKINADVAANGDTDAQMRAWWDKNDPGSAAHQEAPNFDDSTWKTMNLPGAWENKGLPDFDGVAWFRRTVEVPADGAGRDLQLDLGSIDDNDTTYWNGTTVGGMQGFNQKRSYTVPGALVKAGRNVIAVRVTDTGGGGGMTGPELSMTSGGQTVSLAGDWKFKQGPDFKSLPAAPQSDANAPTVLYNGKIAPLTPAAIKGIAWYQGESNSDNLGEARDYRTLLPTLIKDWRAKFGEATPFYIVQLANFKAPDDAPKNDAWPNTREAQLLAARDLPNTHLITTIDLGEANNVHYPNKQATGLRLAQSALEYSYGEKIESNGPTLKDAKFDGGAAKLQFDHAQNLNLKGDQDRVFAIAGADKQFKWATPTINGDTVTLRSPDVATPLYARFGWSNNPRAVLYNAAGVPASPFRTDELDDAPAKVVRKAGASDADVMFDGFNRAFLVDSSYYKTSLNDDKPMDTWRASLEIMVAEDAYERTGSAEHKALVEELCSSWLKRTPPPWDWDGWNDDIGWFTMALMRGYQITGNPEFLKQAKYGFDMAYKRGWDTQYNGGGIWEQQPEKTPKGEKVSKEVLSNDSLGFVACLIYQSTKDKSYLDKANQIYDWVWHNLYDFKTGQVYTGVDRDGKVDKGAAVYNQGMFIDYANTLAQLNNSRTHYNDAKRTIDYVKNNLTKNGIITNNQGYIDTWGDAMARGLGHFVRDNNAWDEYYPWMRQNADAIMKNRRTDYDITWNAWDEQTPNDDSLKSTKFASATAWLQYTPDTKPTK